MSFVYEVLAHSKRLATVAQGAGRRRTRILKSGGQKNGGPKNGGQKDNRFHFSVTKFSARLLVDKFAKALPGTIYILDAYCLIQVASVIKSGAKPGVKPSQRRT